jgi:hypothetical protein
MNYKPGNSTLSTLQDMLKTQTRAMLDALYCDAQDRAARVLWQHAHVDPEAIKYAIAAQHGAA